MRPVTGLLGLAAAVAGGTIGAWLNRPVAVARDPADQAELERAVAAVDRELAVDLELLSMFDQTKQAFVLENGQFLAHGARPSGSYGRPWGRRPSPDGALWRPASAGGRRAVELAQRRSVA